MGTYQPHAVQIMDFEDCSEDPSKPRNVKFCKENLESVLNQAGERKVCIVSIAGPSRRGKSFFLSFLIRYLEALEKDEPDWLGWENKDEPLTGFKWTTAIEHETSGMLVWSKPFIVKSNDQEVAILLVDTQGTYDKATTPRERAAIVGLSLLTSSCLIFNFFDMLQEDCLESLHTYVNYGLMAMNPEAATEDESIRPFQRLYFLIRDWRMPTTYPFGAEGGKKYLKKVLEIEPKMPSNVKEVRETLHKCFERMDCFLMPGIGEKAQQEGFTGCLSQLSEKFSARLEELVEDLLNPDDIPVKSVFGSEVMAADVLSYFEQYVNVFNCEDTPAPTTLIEATAKIAFQSLISQSFRKYQDGMKKKMRGKKFMPDSVLTKAHQACMKESVAHFKKARKMGTAESANAYEEELNSQLKSEYEKIYSDNEKKRDRLIDESRSEVLKSFRDSMEEEFPDEVTFVDSNKLKVVSSSAKTNAMTDFKDKVGSNLDEDVLEKEIQTLEMKLEEEETRVTIDNQNRQMKAELRMDELVDTFTKEYFTGLNEKLMEDSFMSEKDFMKFEDTQRTLTTEMFAKAKKVGGKDFVKRYVKKLNDSLRKTGGEITKSYKLQIQKAEKEAESVLDATMLEFEDELNCDWDEMWEKSELESKSDKLFTKSIESIQEKIKIPEESELAKIVIAKAEEKLNSSKGRILKEFCQSKRDCEDSYVKAVDSSLEFYVAKMDEFLVQKKFRTDEELEKEHEVAEEKALEEFQTIPKPKLVNHPEPQKFLEQLEIKIRQTSVKNAELNTTRREAALAEAKNVVNDLAQKYQADIMKDIDNMKDMDDLEEHHKLCFMEAQDEFKKTYKNEDFAEPFLIDLEEEIMKAYVEDLKDYFELKLKDRGSETNNALGEARKNYREEMEKHYKNNEFMRPADLEALHDRLSAEAITKCEATTPLSSIQKNDLKSALQLTYQQYKEQNDMNVPVDPAIGIDLGTTYSCAAVYLKGAVKVIPNGKGSNITPSYVCYNDMGYMEMVGQPAKSKAYENAENTIYDAKRILGKDFTDSKLQKDMTFWPFQVVEEQKVPKIKINSGKTFYPEQVSSEVLKELRMDAERFLSCEVTKAVITVPAYFTDGQRQATIDAGKLAGLEVLTILNEPTSAAIAYKLQHSEDHFRHVLVYDLGGGTFDVAVLKISKGKIEALAVDGDTHLGGQDFDQRVMEHCCLEFQTVEGIDLIEGKDSTNATERNEARGRLHRLQQACEDAKKELSSCRTTNIDVAAIYNKHGQSFDLKVALSRNKFEELNEGLFVKTLDFVEKVLASAKLDKSKIEDVVLVGGSTRIPKVQEVLQGYFEGKALSKTVNPDEAVAYGAAIQAAIMNGKIAQESVDYNKIQDVTPMSLGVEVYGGGFSCIIPKNTKIPTKIKDQYRTAHNNQTSVQITIYQGESDVAVDNSWLGEFYLNGIPPAEAGRELIDVTMEINLQGLLQITAVSTSTGDTNSIKVTSDKRRMDKSTIKKILAEAKPGGA